ncbi:MAG: hypothetical protein H8E73_07015, partial [Planctomycetes bacterium]|nr:hypothetical protein [Planctomycetota bacterium]
MNDRRRRIVSVVCILTIALLVVLSASTAVYAEGQVYVKKDSFSKTMLACRPALRASQASGGQRAKLCPESARA